MMNMWRMLTAMALVGWFPLLGLAQSTTKPQKTCVLVLDKVLNWKDPLALKLEQFEEAFTADDDGRPSYRLYVTAYGGQFILIKKGANVSENSRQRMSPGTEPTHHELRWGESNLSAAMMQVQFNAEPNCRRLLLYVISKAREDPTPAMVMAELTKQIGAAPTDAVSDIDAHGERVPTPVKRWVGPDHQIDMMSTPQKDILISVKRLSPDPTIMRVALDPWLRFGEIWKLTQDEMETRFTSTIEGEKKKQFEWLNAARDRARFSRTMPDHEVELSMFGGAVSVEEAVVEFVKGRAARVIVSFYNRGDSGEIRVQEFERTYKKVGLSLTESLKLQPRTQLNSSNAALKTTGWNWTTPAGIAFLEYDDYTSRGVDGKPSEPQFLRLKLAAPDQADWSMGKLAVGVQRMALTKNITKNAGGDVFIAGIPMVDQGAKGYCVAASCQRLFEYMRIPCDQHEMAKLISADAERGASIMVMQKSLAKVDSQFQVAFRPLVNPLNYIDNRGNRRVSMKEFAAFVKEHVDKGVPLLWGLELGLVPETPPLPRAGQTGGGHMRLVIGYNAAKNQLLFTDSWGAGHELKRMKADDAYEVTLGLYSMSPRGM